MRKSNSTLAKTLGMGAIAAATAFMPMKANSALIDEIDYSVTTTISLADRDGDGQIESFKFDYEPTNLSSDFNNTQFSGFGTKDVKLSDRGLEYDNTLFGANWDYTESTTDSMLTVPQTGGFPIYQDQRNIFTFYAPTNNVIGFEEISSKVTGLFGEYSLDSSGSSLALNDAIGTHQGFFTSQIPEPATIGLLGLGGLIALLERRRKRF